MKDLLYKAAAIGASASLFLATAGAVSADTLTIRNNGARSRSTITVMYDNGGTTTQTNDGNTTTTSDNNADTGNNDANSNTNGAVSITTGEAEATTTVTNTGHLNTANDTCGCADADPLTAEIAENGADSVNAINYSRLNDRNRTQRNTGNTVTVAGNTARTGRNRTNSNTGPGNVTVTTEDATSTTTVTNVGHENR